MQLKEVRSLLPINGMRVLSERTNIPYTEISRMYKGLETKNTNILVKETALYLTELQAKQTNVIEVLNKSLETV